MRDLKGFFRIFLYRISRKRKKGGQDNRFKTLFKPLHSRLIEFIQKVFPEALIGPAVLIAYRGSVDPVRPQTEAAGTGDDDFIRVEQVIQTECLFPVGDVQSGTGPEQVSPGDTGQDHVVCRCRIQSSTLQNMDIAVSALGHAAARSIEDRFRAAGGFRFLGGHDGRDQVEGLDITVEKTCIFRGDQLDRIMAVRNLSGNEGDPEITGAFRESMTADSCSARDLVIDEQVS